MFQVVHFCISCFYTLLLIDVILCVLYVCILVKLQERVLCLVCKAYRTIRVSDLCALLGQTEEEVRQGKGSPC